MIQNTFRFPDDLYWRLREMAGDNRLSKNAQALILLDEGLAAHGYPGDPAAVEQAKARAPDADRGGTRPKMDDEKAEQARHLLGLGWEIGDVAAFFGVHRSTLYDHIGATGRVGGQELKMTAEKKAEARRLIDDEGMSPAEVAEALGVSLPTLYRQIGPVGRAHKLTPDQVRQIKVRFAPKPGRPRGEADDALAREFGVSPRTIGLIRHGRTWRHVVIEA